MVSEDFLVDNRDVDDRERCSHANEYSVEQKVILLDSIAMESQKVSASVTTVYEVSQVRAGLFGPRAICGIAPLVF